jgi:hypothetical protein
VNAILLRLISRGNPDRLVLLPEVYRKQGGEFINPSTANCFDWREQTMYSGEWLAFRFGRFQFGG